MGISAPKKKSTRKRPVRRATPKPAPKPAPKPEPTPDPGFTVIKDGNISKQKSPTKKPF